MSGSQSSSEDGSSGGNSSDEGSGSESGSGSSSGSGEESSSNSDSDSDSDSGSSSGSGSGSGSGSSSEEDDDNGSSSSGSGSEDSGDSEEEEEEEEEGDTEEKLLARKREDFEKMKEISLHMDNIVQRLSTFFPRDDKESGKGNKSPDPPVPPELPALPLSPPDKVVDRSVSARVMTMDRAVSARRLTTDRAVSVASGLHFDDDLSASTVSNTRYEEEQNAGSRRAAGNGQGVAGRRQSATDADWTGRDRIGPERRGETRYQHQHQADETRAAQRRESWHGGERNTNNADVGLGQKREPGGGRRRSRVSPGSPAAELGVGGSHERLLWDDLRESLEGATGGERIPARSSWARSVAVEKTKEERDREQRRRRLIDEAIAVLLEGSSDSSSSSDD